MDVRIMLACAAAFVAASLAYGAAARRWTRRRHIRDVRMGAGVNREQTGFCNSSAVQFVFDLMRRQTRAPASDRNPTAQTLASIGTRSFPRRIATAGASSQISVMGAARARVLLAVTGAGVCAVAGSVATVPLAILGGILGFAAGWNTVPWALEQESKCRRRGMERHLSEAIDVICLGLRAGLSFDRSLDLYCDSFESGLSRELRLARNEWAAGLSTRSAALHTLAATYDSPLFGRIVDDIVRSMRFGSPLADSLEKLAAEARQSHKAQVEEEVMRAPVKMMVPVGTLILPSMLMLVMGPILLDLMQGF